MPTPYELWRGRAGDGDMLVGNGPMVLFRYDPDDRALRNLAIVALTDAGVAGKQVAQLFGLSKEHVSRLRTKVATHGSSGLLSPMGAPRKLTARQENEVLRLAAKGRTGAETAARFSVSQATISRLLNRRRQQAVPQRLLGDEVGEEIIAEGQGSEEASAAHLDTVEEPEEQGGEVASGEVPGEQAQEEEETETTGSPDVLTARIPRLGKVEVSSRYAGAMLLHPFLSRLGTDAVVSSIPTRSARRYDASSLVSAAALSFALGSSSLEGSKHLVVEDAGALLGLEAFPRLRTLRPSLKALAEACDPIEVQAAFAKAMLSADEHPPEVFYIDDHFVTYWGKRPVAKGYNIRRHLAEPGRDDTFVVDDTWRAICFSSGEPRGLSVSLPGVLFELKALVGERRVLVGFDRGGSYPKVFSAIAEANMDWVTWRRAPLLAPTVDPCLCLMTIEDKERALLLSDELVALKGYEAGAVRQLSAFEGDRLAFQVLTSNQELDAASMLHKLRGRWCIENTNKYLEDHQGVHWLCSYEMDTEEYTAKLANPARRKARQHLHADEAALAEAERALGRCADEPSKDIEEHLRALQACRDGLATARDDLKAAKAALKAIPAKLPANELDPNAKRAKPRLAARALQMVCRLLAYNAELDLARRLNAYLADPDEYRAICRNLLHLGGRIAYERRRVTVTLDRPDSPRIARALGQVLEELNAESAHLPGDRRPITYRFDSSHD
jgi:DNA-binding CsgD family transcriptional regulator